MHIRKCSRAQTDKGIGSDRPEWLGRAQMSTSLSPLLAPMLSSAAMRAICDDAACLQNMLDFEAALARAEAALGVIPASAAGPITNACRAESFDLAALADAATRSGNLAIPLVKALTANVAKVDAEAARYVHWGATSQDVIDTGAMLGLRAGIDALLADIDRAIAGFAGLARQHRHTAVVARTWLQHALPMPFGLKLAEYAAALAPLAAAAAALAPRDAGAAIRRRGRHARRPRRQGIAGRGKTGARNSSCRCPTRPGTPTATASRKRPPCSRSSPAPAARSRATFR